MTPPSPQAAPGASGLSAQRASVSDPDFSCRLPLLILFLSAAVWLVLGWIFELIASLKFHNPGFLADQAWLTYGRVHPAFINAVIYGFCLQAGLGVTLWILAQTGGVKLAQRGLVSVGASLWNLGVTLGVIGILAGDSTGFNYLEMPGYASILVFLGYLTIALWGVVTFHQRRERTLTAAQWFLFTALFWFPWIYSTANLLLVAFPVRGVAQAVIAWWYADNLLFVWLSLTGLGAVFYLVPKLSGRELHSQYLAMFAYWVLIVAGGWGGVPASAPVPVWMPVLSTISKVLLLLVVVAVGLNTCETLGCSFRQWHGIPGLSFLLFGVLCFLLVGCSRAGSALLDFNQGLQFTWFGPAVSRLNFYGFFGMTMFGAIYVILPRLIGLPFPWPKLVGAHFWISVLGLVLMVVPLAISGVVQETALGAGKEPFVAVMRSTLMFLRVSTLGELLLLLGNALFLANGLALVAGFYRTRATASYAELTTDLFKPAGAKP